MRCPLPVSRPKGDRQMMKWIMLVLGWVVLGAIFGGCATGWVKDKTNAAPEAFSPPEQPFQWHFEPQPGAPQEQSNPYLLPNSGGQALGGALGLQGGEVGRWQTRPVLMAQPADNSSG